MTTGRAVLYRDDGSKEIQQHAYDHWVDSPTLMLQQAFATYLRGAGVAETVVTPETRVDVDWRLGGRLLRFERVLGSTPRIVLQVELVLTKSGSRELLLLQTYTEERPTSGSGVEASVEAFDQALAAVLQRFVADIPGA